MSDRLSDVLYIRVPSDLTAALSEAAQRELLPVTTWARRVLAVRRDRELSDRQGTSTRMKVLFHSAL
jgi:hypothetical protein